MIEKIITGFMVAAVFAGSFLTRWPFLFKYRGWDALFVGCLALVLLVFVLVRMKTGLRLVLVVLLLFSLINVTYKEIHFHYIKDKILNNPGAHTPIIGRHFVVGYEDFNEIKKLAHTGAIGGIFLSGKNVDGKSIQQVRAEIDELQEIRSKAGLPPLIVATDQEGGIVSRLSPPLTQQSGLSSLVSDGELDEEEFQKYMGIHAGELEGIGVNMNFAPVVDINEGVVGRDGDRSRISDRAISDDSEVVGEIALKYCRVLKEYGINCTLKHYPGLGRVKNDTHIMSARLDYSLQELSGRELIPFNMVNSEMTPVIMLSHVILPQFDVYNPASTSQIIVGRMRNVENFDGVLITDDFTMGAISGSGDRVEGAALKSLNAGVDLILISYDYELYYYVMDAMLKLYANGFIDKEVLEMSDQRLDLLQGFHN